MERSIEVQQVMVLGIFHPELLDRYGFVRDDAQTLQWFLFFASSGKMKRMPQRDGVYFWVNYDYAAKSLYTTTRSIQANFDHLCGYNKGELLRPGLVYPVSKIVIPTASGKRSFFGFNREPMSQIVDWNGFSKEGVVFMEKSMNSYKLLELEEKEIPSGAIRREIRELLEDLLNIHQRGKDTPLLFSNRMPKSSGKPTKTIMAAVNKIQAIYEGRFIREYRISAEFTERNNQLIDETTWKKIASMKGSWTLIREGLFEAVRNYRQWFWPEKEPESKDWLPKDLSTWLFDEYGQSSLFLATLNRGPFPVREKAADRVYDTIPGPIKDMAEELYQEGWDSLTYWRKIREIVVWYKSSRATLEGLDINTKYWLDGGVTAFFKRYSAWLRELAGNGIFLNQIGLDCPTWNAWCTWGAKKHNFKVSVLKKSNNSGGL